MEFELLFTNFSILDASIIGDIIDTFLNAMFKSFSRNLTLPSAVGLYVVRVSTTLSMAEFFADVRYLMIMDLAPD